MHPNVLLKIFAGVHLNISKKITLFLYQLPHLKCYQNNVFKKIYKPLRLKYDQRCVASFPNRKPCGQLPSADLQWSEPTPGSGLRGHSHKTAGNPLSSARITTQQDQTVVYLLCFNELTVGPSRFLSCKLFYFIESVESMTNKIPV